MFIVSPASTVKTYVLSKFLENETFDTNNFSTISSFYGDGMLPTTDSHFTSSYAWLWYNSSIHYLAFGDNIYDIHMDIINMNNTPVINMGEGFKMMNEHTFSELIDIEVDYMEIEEGEIDFFM